MSDEPLTEEASSSLPDQSGGCDACRVVGPLLTAPGTSGRSWVCECGAVWPGASDFAGSDLRTPVEWEAVVGQRVLDPDGWRNGAPLGPKDWDEPITLAEFRERLGRSTVGPPRR